MEEGKPEARMDIQDVSERNLSSNTLNLLEIDIGISNLYMQDLEKFSGIHILQQLHVEASFKKSGPLGLFFLFFPKQYLEVLLGWTNLALKKTRIKQ